MTQEEKARAYDEVIGKAQNILHTSEFVKITDLIPELRESEDERIIRFFAELATDACGGPGQEYYEELGLNYDKVMAWLEKQKERGFLTKEEEYTLQRIIEYLEDESCPSEWIGLLHDIYCLPYEKQKEQKTIEMEVYEVGKGTTICGQDYKCKKDFKEGNCWYIKDAIYHCGRDGYLTDQNDVSWSCTPEWFNEYIYTDNELAEKEKNDFVSGQFLQCKFSFDGFKEGEHYWLEYIGDDMYVGRSDNILNQKFHITPRQLYTLFSQKLEEVQGPPQEEKQVLLNYEPPFDENPSDREIIEALIKHLKEQDGFLTAIDSVSTKAILSWLEKQKEPHYTKRNALFDKCVENCDPAVMKKVSDEIDEMLEKEQKPVDYEAELKKCKDNPLYFFDKYVSIKQKSTRWSYPYGRNETVDMLVSLAECLEMDGNCLFNEHTGKEYGKFLRDLARKQVECKPEEWSNKEQTIIEGACSALKIHGHSKLADKLKSLRLQPKAELTLLDKNIIEAAVAFVEQNDHFNCWRGIDKHMVIKALRSLKPHWKLSEEQDYSGLSDLERAIHRGFLCAGVENVPVVIIKETAQDCIASLPLSWKPNEEQIATLRRALYINPASGKLHELKENEICILQSLLEQLNKLYKKDEKI